MVARRNGYRAKSLESVSRRCSTLGHSNYHRTKLQLGRGRMRHMLYCCADYKTASCFTTASLLTNKRRWVCEGVTAGYRDDILSCVYVRHEGTSLIHNSYPLQRRLFEGLRITFGSPSTKTPPHLIRHLDVSTEFVGESIHETRVFLEPTARHNYVHTRL
jgi:hypothetical protein